MSEQDEQANFFACVENRKAQHYLSLPACWQGDDREPGSHDFLVRENICDRFFLPSRTTQDIHSLANGSMNVMESFPEEHGNNESISSRLELYAGNNLRLIKRKLLSDQESAVSENQALEGFLSDDVKIGHPVTFDNGTNTSPIQDIFAKNDRYFIQTRTSIYEIIQNNPEAFSGLELTNKYGDVHSPSDAKIADLEPEVVDIPLVNQHGDYSVYINKKELGGLLLEINDGQLFRAMRGRFIVVAKIENGHLPFYVSSGGTDGKNQGEWYPFFGYTGQWAVKGKVGKNGEMYYSDAIKAVQDTLNENFRFPSSYISPRGKFGTGRKEGDVEPPKVFADLSEHLKYQNRQFQDEFRGSREGTYVRKITGYNPEHVVNDDKGSSQAWIRDIVTKLG